MIRGSMSPVRRTIHSPIPCYLFVPWSRSFGLDVDRLAVERLLLSRPKILNAKSQMDWSGGGSRGEETSGKGENEGALKR